MLLEGFCPSVGRRTEDRECCDECRLTSEAVNGPCCAPCCRHKHTGVCTRRVSLKAAWFGFARGRSHNGEHQELGPLHIRFLIVQVNGME
jgi:hypothetical protein